MQNENNPNYYAVIPAHVRYCKKLEPSAKLLYGEITALSNRYGYCWATNAYFAELYGISTDTITRWVRSLKEHGFIDSDVIMEGMQRSRKIWITPEIKNIFARLQKCQDVPLKMPGRTGENVGYNITPNNTHKKEDLSCPTSAEPQRTKESTPIKKEISKEAQEAAKKLLSKVKEIHPKFKEPKEGKWEEEMDKLHRIDKRGWEEINSMIDWAFSDKFWVKVLMSPDGLRRNWDKMAIKQIELPSTPDEKNREIATEVKVYLGKIGKGNLLWIGKDFVKNMSNGDSILLNLQKDKFEEILCNWFELKRV